MTLPIPPSDNLYKFIAIGGLILVALSLFITWQMEVEIDTQRMGVQARLSTSALERKLFYVKSEYAKKEADSIRRMIALEKDARLLFGEELDELGKAWDQHQAELVRRLEERPQKDVVVVPEELLQRHEELVRRGDALMTKADVLKQQEYNPVTASLFSQSLKNLEEVESRSRQLGLLHIQLQNSFRKLQLLEKMLTSCNFPQPYS